MCAPDFDIRNGDVVIARVERPTYTHVAWSQFPVLGAPRVAHVAASANGLLIEGTASFDQQEFVVKRSIDVVGKTVRIPRGARVSLLGTTNGLVAISAETRFAAPATVEATVACDVFGYEQPELVRAGPPYARPKRRSIALRATRGGPTVFAFAPRDGDAWTWLERDGDWVHVLGGHFAWRKFADRTSVLFDGWVAASDVERVDQLDFDWDTGCEPPDIMDTCGPAYAVRDATVLASPKGPAIGTLAHGSHLKPLEKRDGFTAFEMHNREIVAPKGSQFWLADADVSTGCSGLGFDDGCPCP
jgi:hypothetical protein